MCVHLILKYQLNSTHKFFSMNNNIFWGIFFLIFLNDRKSIWSISLSFFTWIRSKLNVFIILLINSTTSETKKKMQGWILFESLSPSFAYSICVNGMCVVCKQQCVECMPMHIFRWLCVVSRNLSVFSVFTRSSGRLTMCSYYISIIPAPDMLVNT